ncbi:hypothetical protein ACFL3G_05015 [Planctomycetota bacterium]
MIKKILILAFLITIVGVAGGKEAVKRPRKPKPLRDGFAMSGVDGRVVTAGNKATWYFMPFSDVTDDKGVAKADKPIAFLPSAGLEKLIASTKKHASGNYKLWGRVTQYEGRNYIFVWYFVEISEAKPARPKDTEPNQSQKAPSINDPNDTLMIPKEVLAKLRTRKIVRTEQLEEGLNLKQDSILADRIGFIRGPWPVTRDPNQEYSFVLDGLGRKAGQVSFPLLPCNILERAVDKQSRLLDPPRFKVAGIVTKYKDKHYLLLQRAKRIYTHGNFN